MAKRREKSALAQAKWRSQYNFDTQAQHLNINSRCLCERILAPRLAIRGDSVTDNPANVTCRVCIMAWDAINDLGLKMKWPVAMWSTKGQGWVLIPLPHFATLTHHMERIVAHMGGVEAILASQGHLYTEPPPKDSNRYTTTRLDR